MMNHTHNKLNTQSIVLILFTAVVCVMVLFALASSASLLGQVVAFILAMVAFLSCVGLALHEIKKSESE